MREVLTEFWLSKYQKNMPQAVNAVLPEIMLSGRLVPDFMAGVFGG